MWNYLAFTTESKPELSTGVIWAFATIWLWTLGHSIVTLKILHTPRCQTHPFDLSSRKVKRVCGQDLSTAHTAWQRLHAKDVHPLSEPLLARAVTRLARLAPTPPLPGMGVGLHLLDGILVDGLQPFIRVVLRRWCGGWAARVWAGWWAAAEAALAA